jgi:predicted lipoprotein with Yx(FWY)xxD motif
MVRRLFIHPSMSGQPQSAARRRTRRNWALVAALGLAALLVAAVTSPVMAGTQSRPNTAVPVTSTTAHILVTANGRTVYVFASDSKNKSACYGQCAKFWPPVLVKKGTSAPKKIGRLPGTFGTAPRKDGSKQLTYDGAPLYTFIEDKKKGDMTGQGLIAAGNYWWVVVAGGK